MVIHGNFYHELSLAKIVFLHYKVVGLGEIFVKHVCSIIMMVW